jgi:hypothetical protein
LFAVISINLAILLRCFSPLDLKPFIRSSIAKHVDFNASLITSSPITRPAMAPITWRDCIQLESSQPLSLELKIF